MGYGEDYLAEFDDWYNALDRDHADQFRLANPAPKGWCDFYERYQREDG